MTPLTAGRRASSPASRLGAVLPAPAALLLAALALRLLFFTGLTGSDDTTYAIRALETARGEFLASDYVGALRYGVNLPMAAFVQLFGANTVGLHAWPMLCSLGEVLIVFLVADRLWGRRAAWAAGLLLATAPLHIHAGGRALADAPLAFFVTLGLSTFLLAERGGHRPLYVVAGAAIGFTWWIKPPTIIFGALLLAYAVLQRRFRPAWLALIAAFAATIAIEWLLFAIWFGDPFHALRAITQGIDKNFVKTDAPWGYHAPFFYFRQMFVDGRDFFLVPALALMGLVLMLGRGADRGLRGGGYVVLWTLGLLLIFSFTPYSLSPFKLIPKQSNYALIFLAPLALLGAYGLAMLRNAALRWLLLGAAALGGVVLASLPQQQMRFHQATLAEATRLAYANSGDSYLPRHALKLIQVRAMMGQGEAAPARFKPVQLLLDQRASGGLEIDGSTPRLAFAHPRWPEFTKLSAAARSEPLLACPALQRQARAVESDTFGSAVLDALLWLRERLPRPVARQLGFAADMRDRAPLDVQACAVAIPGLAAAR